MYTIIAADQYDTFGTLDYLRDNSTGNVVVAVYVSHQADIKAPEFVGSVVILCTPGSLAYIFGNVPYSEHDWDIYDHWKSYAAYCQWLNRNTMPTL